MATVNKWQVIEDGCIALKTPITGLTYHSSLNTVIVTTAEPAVGVIDVTSGCLLQKSNLSAGRSEKIHCQYLPDLDRTVFWDDYALGVRGDMNGVLLLDTALQVPVSKTEDTVQVELPLAEASQLFKALMSAELPGMEFVEDVLKELERGIDSVQEEAKSNHKMAKWSTVTLKLPHCALKNVCTNLVMEMKRLKQHSPGLSISSAVADRLSYLLNNRGDNSLMSSGQQQVDRAQMYSEAARRETFSKWPHMSYKWALPEPMAQAGFYHQPNSLGDDRAMCFTCIVCLMCWEPTDEPWSEHERHSPSCPFVKGEHTQNVPLSVTYATQPSSLHGDASDKIACVSQTTVDHFLATSTLNGNVVIWDTSHLLRKCCQFNIDPTDTVISSKLGIENDDSCLSPLKTADQYQQDCQNGGIIKSVKNVEIQLHKNIVPQKEGSPSTSYVREPGDGKETSSSSSSSSSSNSSITSSGGFTDVPLNETSTSYSPDRGVLRPSQDIQVYSLCLVDRTGDDGRIWHGDFHKALRQTTLICGVSVRSMDSTACVNEDEADKVTRSVSPGILSSNVHTSISGNVSVGGSVSVDSSTDVLMMNQVNQALGIDSEPLEIIIPDSNIKSSSLSPQIYDESPVITANNVISQTNAFPPYLLLLNPYAHVNSQTISGANSNKPSTKPKPLSNNPMVNHEAPTFNAKLPESFLNDVSWDEPLPGEPDWSPYLYEFDSEELNTFNSVQIFPTLNGPSTSTDMPNLNTHCDHLDASQGKSSDENCIDSLNSVPSKPKSVISSTTCKRNSVIQFLELPAVCYHGDFVIGSITPTLDKRYVLVTLVPSTIYQAMKASSPPPQSVHTVSENVVNGIIDEEECRNIEGSHENIQSKETFDTSNQDYCVSEMNNKQQKGGYLLYYKVDFSSDQPHLISTPVHVREIDDINLAISSILILPHEVSTHVEDEDRTPVTENGSILSVACSEQVAVTTYSGIVQILNISDFHVVAEIPAPEDDSFVSLAYCSGIERLCASTRRGVMYFYQVSRHEHYDAVNGVVPVDSITMAQTDDFCDGGSSEQNSKESSQRQDSQDHGHGTNSSGLLADMPLTNESLIQLNELTKFENLMPRFTATVPPCWTEVQQEQQQRRHPQHLQHQGEATQHTRTWKLQTDSSTWDEHLFELVLPRPCYIGHVDIKFTLHPLVINPPHIQITLLKQNLGSLGKTSSPFMTKVQHSTGCPVDQTIDFNMKPVSASPSSSVGLETSETMLTGTTDDMTEMDDLERLEHGIAAMEQDCSPPSVSLDPNFLQAHNAEVLCAPVNLASCIDLSRTSGLLSLTSSQLLCNKVRSFLIHIKAMNDGTTQGTDSEAKDGAELPVPGSFQSSAGKSSSSSSLLNKSKSIKSLIDSLSPRPSRPKLENVKGCDLLQEISVTVRRCKRIQISKERSQRCAMLNSSQFHERLLNVVCCEINSNNLTACTEHLQNVALDILCWLVTITGNNTAATTSVTNRGIVHVLSGHLNRLVKACFINGCRTTAHKFARLIMRAIEYTRNSSDVDLPHVFNFALLQALLDCLPLLTCAYSSAGVKWYFALLNLLKHKDGQLVGQMCIDMLSSLAKTYHERMIPAYAFLKTRYGFHGHPFESNLFELEPPPLIKVTSPQNTYATAVSNTNASYKGASIPNSNISVYGAQDVIDFKDLFLSPGSDKANKLQFDYLSHSAIGLIEVEPLHFTCHATSEGTRVERLEISSSGPHLAMTMGMSGLSGTVNSVGESMGVSSVAGAVMPALSYAVLPLEHHLQGSAGGGTMSSVQCAALKHQQQKQKFEQLLLMAEVEKAKKHGVNISVNFGPPGTTSVSLNPPATAPAQSELIPPTPKTTPLFMTPPVTPPNESNIVSVSHTLLQPDPEPSKPAVAPKLVTNKSGHKSDLISPHNGPKPATVNVSPMASLLQAPPPQALVIERMHSGARRFVALDFGKPIILTDLIIPACADLASLSVDVWVQSEEVDGTRLIVASDIKSKSLVMNNIMPAPICRYLKITTIGGYGSSTTKSRIPIGSFYGHTYILPWEWEGQFSVDGESQNKSGSVEDHQRVTEKHVQTNSITDHPQPELLAQVTGLLSLIEDIQCRYSLAKTRLEALLYGLEGPQVLATHAQFYNKKSRSNISDEDLKIMQAYNDCMQLQQQLNLALRATDRLHQALGMSRTSLPAESSNLKTLLKHTCTDKIRFLMENLLDAVLGMTVPMPTLVKVPFSIYSMLTPDTCASLFRYLCVCGSQRIQLHTGLLLVRVCGSQPWWGEFLANVLHEFFNSQQTQIFPQDRVFVLFTALGQRSLRGPCATTILDSLLNMLAQILAPLLPSTPGAATSASGHGSGSLDLCLVSWVLLFLSRNLDNTSVTNSADDSDRARMAKDNGAVANRWNFVQNEAVHPPAKGKTRASVRTYRRSVQKRLFHHKQMLMDLEQAKKRLLEKASSNLGSPLAKEAHTLVKQEQILKKELTKELSELQQCESKHLKDIVQMRRTDGEILRKLPKDDLLGGALKDSSGECECDSALVLPREKCLPVVRGLVSLLLSMDFTCSVDLFLIACKVLARICLSSRPAICLTEAMTTGQLEELILLATSPEFGQIGGSWGGPWAQHAISCLLQDILNGERLFPASLGLEGVTDDEISARTLTDDTDDSMPNSMGLATVDEGIEDTMDEMDISSAASNDDKANFDKESLMMVEMLLDEELDDLPPSNAPKMPSNVYDDSLLLDGGGITVSGASVGSVGSAATMQKDTQLLNAFSAAIQATCNKKQKIDQIKSKLADNCPYIGTVLKSSMSSSGISSALDARLEYGLDTLPEIRLRTMVSVHTEAIQTTLLSPTLAIPPPEFSHSQSPSPATDDDQMTAASLLTSLDQQQQQQQQQHGQQILCSNEMLSACFDSLFAQLPYHRVNLESLLQLWLTLNTESTGHHQQGSDNDSSVMSFDPSWSPTVPLSVSSVSHLMTALTWTPNELVSTWVLAFQVLTILCNQKVTLPAQGETTHEVYMASAVMTNNCLLAVLSKFLSGVPESGPAATASLTQSLVGPSACRAFLEFVSRLQIRSMGGADEQLLKELMLKLVYLLTAPRGAFHTGTGPLDAQCRFLPFVLMLSFDQVDVSNAISVIEAVSALVYQHIITQDPVTCQTSAENNVSARSCFGGMFANLIRGGDNHTSTGNCSRDMLMCDLLRLLNLLIHVGIPSPRETNRFAPRTSAVTINAAIPVQTPVRPPPLAPASQLMSSALPQCATDSTKLSRGFVTPVPASLTTDITGQSQTDEQKSDAAAAASSAASSPRFIHTTASSGPFISISTSSPSVPIPLMSSSFQSGHTGARPRTAMQPVVAASVYHLADVVLGHSQIMSHLIHALSVCNSNTMAMLISGSGLSSNIQDSFTGDLVSVGDGIYQILIGLLKKSSDSRLLLEAVNHYLSGRCAGHGMPAVLPRLSEPLIWFILKILETPAAVDAFVEMGGIETVCHNLVRCNQQIVSTTPSLISTVMQHLGNNSYGSNGQKRSIDVDSADGLQNFAPLGTITSSSPSASPADVLIQSSPPHRRARSAAWSYHFYPDEAWVDLTIQLPFAVLLKEVQISPHLTSLATCPAYVSLEISRDGITTTPLSSPPLTSSLAFIKLQLQRPEVVTMLTIRLHKARDSTTIGLSQIQVMGYSAFGENSSKSVNALLPIEDLVSKTSLGWLRLLHHCLKVGNSVDSSSTVTINNHGVVPTNRTTINSTSQSSHVAEIASRMPQLLNTCMALLTSSMASLYSTSTEAVLLKLGIHSPEMGLTLIDNILRNTASSGITPNTDYHAAPYLGRVNGLANDSTLEILYLLGTTQDRYTTDRISALLKWLANCAQVALQKQPHSQSFSLPRISAGATLFSALPRPAASHVHCIATVLWQSHDMMVQYDLSSLITNDLVSSIYKWCRILNPDSNLKRSVDYLLCSLCYINPEYLSLILEWIGILATANSVCLAASISDDRKDGSNYCHTQALTDDTKEARGITRALDVDEIHVHLNADQRQSSISDSQPMILQEFSHMMLHESDLSTLAVVCRSPLAMKHLVDIGFPSVLAQGLYEFCSHEIRTHLELMMNEQTELMTDSSKRHASFSSHVENSHSQQDTESPGTMSADLVVATLHFFGNMCHEAVLKDWLGSPDGNVFWSVLLSMLCNTHPQPYGTPPEQQHTFPPMTTDDRAAISSAAIAFFSSVIFAHPANQHLFAKVLCDTIKAPDSKSGGGPLCTATPLSGFTRRLFLQVLLEDDKLLIALKSSCIQFRPDNNKLSSVLHHPKYGVGRSCFTLKASLHSTCGEIVANVSDSPRLALQVQELKERKCQETGKDTMEIGMEVWQCLSYASGLSAQEKRNAKSSSLTGVTHTQPFNNNNAAGGIGLPPRPPTRRGRYTADGLVNGSLNPLQLALYHPLLPNTPLPADLTLSQLMSILHENGLAEGVSALQLSVSLAQKGQSAASRANATDTDESTAFESLELEAIPAPVLLETTPCQSALHIFASMGGLALLAEHLPLLYPEVTRHTLSTGATSAGTITALQATDHDNQPPDIDSDWVSVENELFWGPVSPANGQVPRPPRQSGSAVPAIPPHSLVAFGLFLRLPGYAEVLLKDRKKAQCLLRLVLGVTDDGDGGHMLSSPIASSLPTLPFHVLKLLFDMTPSTTDDGVLLRRMTLDIGALHLILACLSVLSHQEPRDTMLTGHQEVQLLISSLQVPSQSNGHTSTHSGAVSSVGPGSTAGTVHAGIIASGAGVLGGGTSLLEDKSQNYWAKGTGFGTGSTTSSWDAELALLRQRSEEEHITCLLKVLASFINPAGCIPKNFETASFLTETESSTSPANMSSILLELLLQSCTVPTICSYLRNDSVLDMARHVPLCRSLLELLRAFAVTPVLSMLLMDRESQDVSDANCIGALLQKMRSCVDTYAARLKSNKGKNRSQVEEEENEGLALLIPDIQETAQIVQLAMDRLKQIENDEARKSCESSPSRGKKVHMSAGAAADARYLRIMKDLQFDTYEMVVEDSNNGLKFVIPHHFENNVKGAVEVSNAARARRLAQEAVTLSTSLPLSVSSSVFVRCDEERLDIMKVLITAPDDTPYANGCFEFDIYFPQDYPNSPPYVNLETTGKGTVRFNPNLYNDGKVCLSVLNTWHGRPEEKWNSQTSSFLQVLVSIQSLILVSEPYFNEPGYERSRGTPSGTASSREYDANIRQATVKWAMLEQIRNPSPCFKEVIHKHCWLKRQAILQQCEGWIAEMDNNDKRVGKTVAHNTMALKRHFNQLRDELLKMKPPPDLTDDEEDTAAVKDDDISVPAKSTSLEMNTTTVDASFPGVPVLLPQSPSLDTIALVAAEMSAAMTSQSLPDIPLPSSVFEPVICLDTSSEISDCGEPDDW